MSSKPRIVITGLGLTAPNGNSLGEFRANLLAGKARIAVIDVRHMGRHPAGVPSKRAENRQPIAGRSRADREWNFLASRAPWPPSPGPSRGSTRRPGWPIRRW